MKILAIEKEAAGVNEEDFKPHLKDEARKVLELYQAGIIREIYFTMNDHRAVIILECNGENEAAGFLNSLPLVKEGLISFEINPLVSYDGFSRLIK